MRAEVAILLLGVQDTLLPPDTLLVSWFLLELSVQGSNCRLLAGQVANFR